VAVVLLTVMTGNCGGGACGYPPPLPEEELQLEKITAAIITLNKVCPFVSIVG